MKQKTRKHWALILVCALIVGILPIGNVSSALAEDGELKNPTIDENGVTTWDCVWFGSYLQSDTNQDGTVDEKDNREPIKWRVLSVEGNDAFLMADRNLDMQKFDEDGRNDSITWENCALRTWLNDTFLNKAFTETEQSAIIKTTVDTTGSQLITTEDNVYLLAYDEVRKKAYGFTGTAGSAGKTGEAKNTEYVKQSITTNEIEGYEGNGSWWLRSKNVNDLCADFVNYQGKIVYDTFISDYGVRPVLHLNLSSASCWESAGTVSSDEGNPEETASPTPEVTETAGPEETATPTPEATATAGPEETATPTPEVTETAGPEETASPTPEATATASPAVALSNPTIVKNDKMESGQVVTWDSVYFGSYPQAEVVDTELRGNYEAIGSNYLKEGDLIVDDVLYNDLLTAPNADWDDNGVIILNGDKYRRIQKGDAIYSEDGKEFCYNWSDSVTYHYFKYEPIRWRVLSTDGSTALLLSDVVLDNQCFQTESEGTAGTILLSTTWERSCIRSWLNGYDASYNSSRKDYGSRNFINNAFTDEEQAAVINSTVINSANMSHGTDGGKDTTDKIFFLSESEVYGTETAQKYGFASDAGIYDEARGVKSSTYARAMGMSWDVQLKKYAGNSTWWLRSPGKSKSNIVYVGTWGAVVPDGFGTQYNFGVRPALNVNLCEISPESICLAGTVSSSSTEEGPGDISPSPSPSATPSAAPSQEPTPTTGPSQKPEPSVKPSQEPTPSAKPSQKPTPTVKPSQKPTPTVKPSKKPTPTVKPSQKPSPSPAAVTKSVPTVSKVRSLKAKAGKQMLTVTWKAVSGVDGYQLQISTKKNFKGAKKFTVRSFKTKYVVKKLKGRKKYYVRIRAYKSYTDAKNTRQTVYGKWKKGSRKTK